MSFDDIEQLSQRAYDFISKFNPAEHQDGQTDFDGMYVYIESYKSQDRHARRFEAHRDYVDIQYIVSGREIIITKPVKKLQKDTISFYDDKKDIEFYSYLDDGDEPYS